MKKCRTATAIMWRVTALTLGMWLAAMSYLTYYAARSFYNQWQQKAENVVFESFLPVDSSLPGAMEYKAIYSMGLFDKWSGVRLDLPLYTDPTSEEPSYLRYDTSYETALTYFDLDGNVMIDQGRYYCFQYIRENDWHSGTDQPAGYAYVDLNKVDGISLYGDTWGGHDMQWINFGDMMRLTGVFQGNEFVLHQIARLDPEKPMYNPEELTLGELDGQGKLKWHPIFDSGKTDVSAVHVYTTDIYGAGHASIPIEVNGKTFRSLPALVKADMQEYLKTGEGGYETDSLWKAVIIHRVRTPEGYASAAIRCTPLRTAFVRLSYVYGSTFLVILILLLLLGRRIRCELGRPLEQMIQCGNEGVRQLPRELESDWREPYELEQGYVRLQKSIRQMKLEQQRMEAALAYAENAENSRRQMISNITHELKTPLAVIHSYAEGLQDGIAADKQDQYLKIILEETDRMDAMVLEMLDLSRLEAGKVRLYSDSFSLLELTRATFQRLDTLVQAKGLQIHYEMTEEFEITADEARIGQVVENFASNAIKYTPEGGNIWINIFRHKDNTHFSIENSGPALSEEMLEKIWESFYRGDESRTTKGTGLGLTIAKTIVELHGGSCQAQNTHRGVEFRISLP